MNLAFLMRLWPIYGGGETVTICLANELVKRGYSVNIIYFVDTFNGDIPYIDERINQIKIPDIECNQFCHDSKKSAFVSKQLKCIVKNNQIDILINQWWPHDYLRAIRQETEVKLIKCHHISITRRSIIDSCNLKNLVKIAFYPFYRYYEKRNVIKTEFKCWENVCDKFIVLSPLFLNELQRLKLQFSSTQLDYVYNPLTFSSFLHENEIGNKLKEVLFVGRLNESDKKISRILKCWHNIQKTNKYQDWKLIIVGDGEDRYKLEKMAHKLKLENVSFEGRQMPLSYYKRASIFVMTSAYEGWGMTLLEAQQNGVVPIAMDTYSSLHEIIQNNENGIIVSAGDIQGFTNSLIKLMDNPEYRFKLALNGIKTSKKFSVDKIVDRWEKIFNDLINS